MKMYAELIGNYKSQRIKSLWGNKLQGKSFLVSLFCCCRCILYPGSKIIIAAGTRNQAEEVLKKVTEIFCKTNGWGSSNLKNEINWKETKIGQNESQIMFKNGSFMAVVTSNDNARGKRCNILICDEARMVSKDVIDTVLRRFLTAPRSPKYLNKPEYADLKERNKEIYMSSAWYSSHWMFKKFQSYFVDMLNDGKKYFCCSIPYQISIKENLLDRAQIEDELSESDTSSDVSWMMEMDSLFAGTSANAFFDFNSIDARRKIKSVFYPLELYSKRDIPMPKLATGEERILSVDVALMTSRKNANDASSLMITSNIPVSDAEYSTNLVYAQNYEGLTTDELGIIIMRTYYEYKCTQLVVDTNGLGVGVADYIFQDQYDPQTGKTYKAFYCINDEDMAIRCKNKKDPTKTFWSVKANASFNNEICILLRNGFINGKISIPVHEINGEEFIKSKVKGFSKLSPQEQAMYKIPYIQTSLMINELINLEHENKNGNIKIYEKSGMRKDRYSSLAYNYWVITQIMRNKRPKKQQSNNLAQMLASNFKTSSRKIGMFND